MGLTHDLTPPMIPGLIPGLIPGISAGTVPVGKGREGIGREVVPKHCMTLPVGAREHRPTAQPLAASCNAPLRGVA